MEGVDDEAELDSLDELVASAAAMSVTFEQVIALQQSGDAEGARQALEAASPAIGAFGIAVSEASADEHEEIPALQARADRTADQAFWLLVVSGALGAAVAVAASVLIARSILKVKCIVGFCVNRSVIGYCSGRGCFCEM